MNLPAGTANRESLEYITEDLTVTAVLKCDRLCLH
jgi:hypothetical protein